MAGDLERFAALAHEQWSGWMDYMFSKGIFHDDGTFTLPAWAAERWRRQAATPYTDLPEQEKESDRVEAHKMMKLARQILHEWSSIFPGDEEGE